MHFQFLFVLLYNLNAFTGHGDIVNVEGKDGEGVTLNACEYHMIGFGAFLAHYFEGVMDVFIPDVPPLFHAIYCLYQLQDHAFRNIKARRWLYVYVLL